MRQSKKPLTKDPVLRRIVALLAEQKKSNNALMVHLGLPLGSMYHWKYDANSKAYSQYIVPICEFLNTTPNYLFYGEKGSTELDGLTPQEAEMVRAFRKMDDRKRQCLVETARIFVTL